MTTLASDRRKLVPLVLLILAAAASGGWWWTHRKPANGPLVLQGNVEVRQVNLAFKVAGRIKKLLVDEGDTVTEGQPLATLDRVYFEEALAQIRAQRDQSAATAAKMEAGNRSEEIAQAEAQVAEREAAVLNARITLERADKLLKTAVGSQKTYDDALSASRQADAQLNSSRELLRLMKIGFRKEDIDLAKAQLAEKDAAVKVAERNLTDAELVAPSSGIVLSRVREAGAIVSAGDSVFVLSLTTRRLGAQLRLRAGPRPHPPGQEVELRSDTPVRQAAQRPDRLHLDHRRVYAEDRGDEGIAHRARLSHPHRRRRSGGALRQGMPMTITVLNPVQDGVRVSGAPR